MSRLDAIIVGCGAMGSSISYHMAKRGLKTLTLEKFFLNHPYGSSHGDSRMLSALFFKHPATYKLVRRAHELWLELQKEANVELIRMTGYLGVATEESELTEFARTPGKYSSDGWEYEVLSAKEIKEMFSVLQPADSQKGLLERKGGILFPEKCVEVHVKQAEIDGAEFRFNEPVVSWNADTNGVVVETAKDRYRADKIIFSAGGWTTGLLGDLNLPLKCERQVFLKFMPLKNKEMFSPERLPGFIWLDKEPFGYAVPDFGTGVKAGVHHGGDIESSPDNIRRDVTSLDELTVREFLKKYAPLANGPLTYSTTCMYTNTPDHQYLIDFHPDNKNVIIVSPCSGVGFCASSAIGEVVTEMANFGKTTIDISGFGLSRFC
jgi:monomeric sarcosine oxidase